MKTTLTRLFTVMMLIMVSMGAKADVKVLFGEKGESTFKSDGGTIEVKQEVSKTDATKITVYLIVTPSKGYTMQEKNTIEAYATAPANINPTRAPQASEKLTLDCDDFKDEYSVRTYHVDIDPNLALWVKSANFEKKGESGAKAIGDVGFIKDYSGTYYIRSGSARKWPSGDYYLCPTEGWAFFHAIDAVNSTDNGQPFLTTHIIDSGEETKYIWIVEKHTIDDHNYYSFKHNIKHEGVSRYLSYNRKLAGNNVGVDRMRLHLEKTESPSDDELFDITPYSTYFVISPKKVDEDDSNKQKYLVVNGGNTNEFYAYYINKGNVQNKNEGPEGFILTTGIIGTYNAIADGNAPFYLDDVITRPTIRHNSDNTINITAVQSGATLIYTTDGSTPSTSNGTEVNSNNVSFGLNDGVTTIKAVAVVNNELSNVASYFTPVLFNHKYLIQSQNNGWTVDESTKFHFYMIPGDEESGIIKLNTTSLFRPTMEWKFLNAGDDDGVQYFYIVNNSAKDNENKPYYLCYDGTNVRTLIFDSDNANNFKFKIDVSSGDAGSFNITPYAHRNSGSSTNRFINKSSGNDNKNAINLDKNDQENSRWKFIFSTLDKTAPFTASDAASTSYYKIASVGSSGYYIVPGKPATTSESSAENMKWYFKVAQNAGDTDWLTYYHIINAVTGDYLYFTKDANGNDACLATSNPITEGSANGYMFTWARTATKNTYYIVPKLLKDVSQNQISSLRKQENNTGIFSNLTRGAGYFAWTFEPSTFKCETPVLTYDPLTGKISITCDTPGATIYVAHYDSEPSSSDIPELIEANAYSVEFDALPGYYKAVASRSTGGNDMSDATTSDEIEEFHCLRPIITKTSNHVTITCATPGTTIYYIAGSGEFSETAENYGGSIYNPETGFDTSETVIKAIAVKGGVWSTKSAEALYDKTPTPITSTSDITNMDGVYYIDGSFTASGTIGSATDPFTGEFDGRLVEFSLNQPLFGYIDGAIIKNVIISSASVTTNSHAGAIANVAKGDSRIYNCGVLAKGSTVTTDDDGYTSITSCSSTISGSGYVGGIVGLLDGSSRVINCFSYANITGGNLVGGIVGKNAVATTSSNLKTMVMNCMFYGNIIGGSNKAPIYNGEIISNVGDTGVGNYNYFLADATFTNGIDTYHCALMAEKRFLQRFEFFRQLLNSHRELAGWWATGTFSKTEMAKWVLEPSQLGTSTPYPILKAQGEYPSVVNYDAKNATTQSERNKGGKMGQLNVSIEMGSGGAVYGPPTGAEITTSSLTLNITDKDPDHFNFNYYKVQLPYYNDVGTKNYTGNRVVTGWKITSITGGTAGTFTSSGTDATTNASGEITSAPYNFADRDCTDKDLYSESERVFNQGAYFDVPEGVTAITIQPYWAKCVYLADANADVVYNTDMTSPTNVPNVGGGTGTKYTNGNSYSIAGESQKVFTTMGNAIASSNSGLFHEATGSPSNQTVYDYAVVLVGNYHHYGSLDANTSKPYTVTSIDLDGDNEPDYSYILRFDSRSKLHPVRVDFLNVPGLGMAQKSTGSTGSYNFGIMLPKDWFEVTNTALFRVTQFEYEQTGRAAKPLILHGGVIEQWVSAQSQGNDNQTTYIHVGSNVWFKEFHLGCHQDKDDIATKHPPVSVTGGDYDQFYLTGLYATTTNYEDNAECYINGGRFGKMAGAGTEGIGNASTHAKGNIVWQIQNADIEEFYGGGTNAAKPIEGNITTVITGSHVKRFCGGPKFGDMNPDRTVITTATNCTFGSFFGAGYGGNSYYRAAPGNFATGTDPWDKFNVDWNAWIAGTTKGKSVNNGNYANGDTYGGYDQTYNSHFGGVSTRFDYQFLPQSGNDINVARLFIDFVKFSLATTRNVTSTLTGCTITSNFYGGGSLGKVAGNVTSTLTDCTVQGSVFGGGYDATRPTVQVMSTAGFLTPPKYDTNTGSFIPAAEPYNTSTEYSWEYSATVNSTATAIDKNAHILYTTENLTTLGQVTGNVTLNILGKTLVEGLAVDYEGNSISGDRGGVFGGGDASAVLGNTTVTINATALQDGAAYNAYCVYGGGNSAPVGGNSTVTLQGKTQVFSNVFGGGNEGVVSGSATVNIE